MNSKVTQMDCQPSEAGNPKKLSSKTLISELSCQSWRPLKYNVQHDWSETFIKTYFIGPELKLITFLLIKVWVALGKSNQKGNFWTEIEG